MGATALVLALFAPAAQHLVVLAGGGGDTPIPAQPVPAAAPVPSPAAAPATPASSPAITDSTVVTNDQVQSFGAPTMDAAPVAGVEADTPSDPPAYSAPPPVPTAPPPSRPPQPAGSGPRFQPGEID